VLGGSSTTVMAMRWKFFLLNVARGDMFLLAGGNVFC
jgi:hypothetical protein